MSETPTTDVRLIGLTLAYRLRFLDGAEPASRFPGYMDGRYRVEALRRNR